jgi:hypothetical protein
LAAIERTTDYKKAKRLMGFFDRFLDNIADLPEREALLACWYLFHLNHYAKKYHKMSNDLYNLKSRVLQKLYQENRSIMEATYLIGPDRLNIWLCEDCKETAHAAGLSYADYIREGQYCPKCEIRSIIKEYYSLIEFTIKSFDYRFVFHLPYLRAVQWLQGIDKLPEGIRKQNPYNDKMYLYGRSVTRIEEQLFPVQSVINHLRGFLNDDYNMRIVYNR